MNILVVSISAPPKNSPESLQTGRYIKGLAARHHVTLITGKAVKGWEPYDASVSGYLKSVKKIIELTPLPYRIVALLKKFLPGIVFPDDSFYFIRKLNKLKRITEKPDIIISRALPYTSCVLASGLAKHWNVPWIMHLSDPWADSPFMHLDEREKRRQQQLEKKCIEQAARVSLTSRKTVTFYKNKYPHCEDKFILLPNVFDDEQVNAVPVDFDWPLKFVFTGRLYGKRSVDVLVAALKTAASEISGFEHKTEFLFAGFFDKDNSTLFENSGLSNVKFLGPLSMADAAALQRKASVLISIDALVEEDSRFNLFFPSKLLDYLATRRNILAITSASSTTHQVVDGKFGWCFDSHTITHLPVFLKQMLDRFSAKDYEFFNPSTDFSEFSAEYNSKQLEILCDKIVTENALYVS